MPQCISLYKVYPGVQENIIFLTTARIFNDKKDAIKPNAGIKKE
jgi:hypothetical protein